MASNNEWVPLPQKKNGSNKKSRENQTKLLRQLKEMFGSTFESDIIISVAQNCNWKLEPSIDTLITLSSNAQTTSDLNDTPFEQAQESEYHPWPNQEFSTPYIPTNPPHISEENFLNMNHSELLQQQRELQKFENTRCTDGGANFGSSTGEPNQKVGTASLCGLKVQYRLKGTENSDDDADVVIEEESSDYRIETPEPERVNVCQFLSTPTQCPPRTTFPKVNYINTPSSPRTSQRLPPVVLSTVSSRLEDDINKGYKILILMRGAPGSGKSYLARNIVSRTVATNFAAHIYSTDDYFLKINRGIYVYNSARIQEAHSFNYNRVLNAMRQGTSPIIVDNTNTRAWEMQNYAIIAVEHGYIVETLEPDTPWFRNVHELDIRNKHNVPKARIRAMLDRYEPNITGERLLKMYSLSYPADKKPPQTRQVPPFVPKQSPIIVNSIPDCQFENPTSENEAERLIDNEALNTIAKEYAKPEPVIGINSSSGNVVNESWTEGSSYKEDSFLLEMTNLGAIGSERKVGLGTNQSELQDGNKLSQEEKEEEEKVENAPVAPQVASEDEVKSDDPPTLDNCEVGNEKNCKLKGTSISNCWDFTLLLNGMQIHSKVEDTFDNEITAANDIPPEESYAKCNLVEDTEVSSILASKIDKDYSSSPDTEGSSDAAIINVTELNLRDVDAQPVTPDVLEEIPTLSDKTRSNSDSSSLERVSDVDISQFEMCNTETIDTASTFGEHELCKDANEEKQSTGGLGSLFSFIKNSIIGNDKDKCNNQMQHQSTDTPELVLNYINKLDEPVKTSIPLMIMPDKFLEFNNDNNEDSDLSPIESIGIDVLDRPDRESLLNSNLTENTEFFKEFESPRKESVVNVVEQLLEASSDVEHLERLDFSERKTATKSEELEKNFSEWMENLHIRAKSEEDESKVSKEPIHLVFGGKNIFPEKMQVQTSANFTLNSPKSSSSNSSSSSNNSTNNDNSNGNDNANGGGNANVNENINNVYLINWRESPFPLDATPSTPEVPAALEIKPETCERETYTDPYDFNVLYVGGTDEYKIIDAVNRNINETSRLKDIEEPPVQKLMLHKSTMTNTTILFRGPVFDVDDTAIVEDRSEELMERFQHLPRACVLDIYENLCKRDYNWTIDYIISMQDDVALMYEDLGHQDIAIDNNTETPEMTDTPEPIGTQNNPESSAAEMCEPARQPSQPQIHCRSKRERYRASGDLLALKQELEEKFVMSEESYAPHTLRVKRWKRREFDEPPKPELEAADLMSFEEQPLPFMMEPPLMFEPRKPSRLDHPAMEEEEEEQLTEDEDSLEDEVVEEEMMELRLGYEFIRTLESEFGSVNFQAPEGLFPVIQIRRSMAQELHALWIESVQQQLWMMQEQLDCMIAKDAEYARSLEVEEARATCDANVPNLKEIMDMEMALATYSNDCVKQKYMKKTQNDLASHVTQQTLHEMFPNYDPGMLYEIYEAHARNFDETVKVIEENGSMKSTITMADVLKKRKNLIDELQKESSYQTSRYNQWENLENYDEASGGDYDNNQLHTYEDAVEVARDSRAEARRQLALRNENYQKAAEAYRRKNPEVAAYYSDVAKLHIRNMEAANSMAASAFLAAQTHILEAEDTLDLHFLHVPEAIQALDYFIEHQLSQLTKGCRKYVFIITGRGARSSNGQSKIKPVVVRKLNSKNIRFSEANPGMLKALLRKK